MNTKTTNRSNTLHLGGLVLIATLAALGSGCAGQLAQSNAPTDRRDDAALTGDSDVLDTGFVLTTLVPVNLDDEPALKDPFSADPAPRPEPHLLGFAAHASSNRDHEPQGSHVAIASLGRVPGGIDRAAIRQVARAHLVDVERCYDLGLARDPSLAGHVTIQFSIGPNGRVAASAVAGSSLDDAGVARCIAQAVKRWKFPKPRHGGGLVTVPFELSPK